MAKAERVRRPAPPRPNYYFDRATQRFVPSGCVLLDCLVGGGWAEGKVINVVGDKAVGKTLIAIEAGANFIKKYPKGKIRYRESEATFDPSYAASVGLPTDSVDFGPDGPATEWQTFDDVYEDLERTLEKDRKDKGPGSLYIIDSLDALTTRAALERKVGEDTYGLEKQKMLGQMLQEQTHSYKATNTTVLFISQTREIINAMPFGKKYRRVCGKVLDFYCSQILWLSHMGKIRQTIRGIKIDTGIEVKALSEKNKVGAATGDCEFSIRFKYGIDDLWASLAFLSTTNGLKPLGVANDTKALVAYADASEALVGEDKKRRMDLVKNLVIDTWEDIHQRAEPKYKKYDESGAP